MRHFQQNKKRRQIINIMKKILKYPGGVGKLKFIKLSGREGSCPWKNKVDDYGT